MILASFESPFSNEAKMVRKNGVLDLERRPFKVGSTLCDAIEKEKRESGLFDTSKNKCVRQ